MKEQITKVVAPIKEFWGKLSSKAKKLILIIGGAVLAGAIALTVMLNISSGDMRVLYPGLSASDSTQVYSALQEMGVPFQTNQNGEITVPKEQWGEIQLQLAAKGYPQSPPAYGIYLDNTGFTRTESERKEIQKFQTQDRLQETLMQTKGVKLATVTLAIPDDSTYVWDTQKEESSASVTITMEPGYELSEERVLGIKNLVAFGVLPQIDPDNVKVIDAATGVELMANQSELEANGLSEKRLDFEQRVQKSIEDNIKRLLTPIYGSDGVTAVAWVTLDYDKMLTQQHQLAPEEDGNGVKTHFDEHYTVGGNVPVSGVVGEENNTDTPSYPNQTGDGTDGAVTDYDRNIDWDISYIDTQIEKGQAILKDASVAVLVRDSDFTQQKHDDLLEMVSKSVNIRQDAISIKNYDLGISEDDGEQPTVAEPNTNKRLLLIIIIAAAILLILIILLVVFLMHRRNKKRLAMEEAESANRIRDLQTEIEQHKKEILENAQAASQSPENVITNEVRQFAKENPEITANLIRSMLKEEE